MDHRFRAAAKAFGGLGMAKRGKMKVDDRHNLGSFQELPADQGLSLDELTGSLAELMGRGSDPYQPAADDERGDDSLTAAATAHANTGDSDTCPVSPRSILEAMLFVGHPGDQPLTSKQVASLMRGVRASEIDDLVAELNKLYGLQGCPYFVDSQGAGYRLTLRDQFAPLREVFYGKVRDARLSQAAVDVLAIVAYNEPISKQQVNELRNETSGRILNQLVRRELLKVERTAERPRRVLYRTTSRFLSLFGLRSLDELPQSQDFDRR